MLFFGCLRICRGWEYFSKFCQLNIKTLKINKAPLIRKKIACIISCSKIFCRWAWSHSSLVGGPSHTVLVLRTTRPGPSTHPKASGVPARREFQPLLTRCGGRRVSCPCEQHASNVQSLNFLSYVFLLLNLEINYLK